MNAMWKEVAVVALLLVACVVALALGFPAEGAMLAGAAVALVLPRAPTAARVLIVGGALALGSTGCAGWAEAKPVIRSAVRVGCEAADYALSGEDDCATQTAGGER